MYNKDLNKWFKTKNPKYASVFKKGKFYKTTYNENKLPKKKQNMEADESEVVIQ